MLYSEASQSVKVWMHWLGWELIQPMLFVAD